MSRCPSPTQRKPSPCGAWLLSSDSDLAVPCSCSDQFFFVRHDGAPAVQTSLPMCVHVTLDWTLERKLDRCQRIFHKSRFPLHKFSVCALQLVVCEVDNAYSFYEAAAVNLPPLAPGSASAMRETRRETHLVFFAEVRPFFWDASPEKPSPLPCSGSFYAGHGIYPDWPSDWFLTRHFL